MNDSLGRLVVRIWCQAEREINLIIFSPQWIDLAGRPQMSTSYSHQLVSRGQWSCDQSRD